MRHKTVMHIFAGMFLFICSAHSIHAAAPIVDSGQLLGATGILVDGQLFNVSFVDGNCISIFAGCDELSDFSFNSFEDADAAAAALLDQALLDTGSGTFDSEPELTFGCDSEFWCVSNIPYGFAPGGGVLIAGAFNEVDGILDRTTSEGTEGIDPSNPLTSCCVGFDELNFALFTPVPVPPAVQFFGSGIAALLFRLRLS